jgi:putative transposase
MLGSGGHTPAFPESQSSIFPFTLFAAISFWNWLCNFSLKFVPDPLIRSTIRSCLMRFFMGGAALQRCVDSRLSEMRFSAKGFMTIPYRGTTGDGTYFVTSSTFQKKALLQSERTARLFIETLLDYRIQRKYELHEFVVMPDHFHLLISPIITLEKAVQLMKGGFSFRAGRLFRVGGNIWQSSFHDRRVRDAEEYAAFKRYIHWNPVKRGLAEAPEEYAYSSAAGGAILDPAPQRLKPLLEENLRRSAEALLHP